MKKERIKKLEKELKYLIDSEKKKEVEENKFKLEDESISIIDVANEIYLKRGIDPQKIRNKFDLVDLISELVNTFKNKDKTTKNKMILEIIYIIILIILIKIPFDLVRDIGYEYIEILSSKPLFYSLWNLLFLLIYTITILCALIVFLRNFVNKYKGTTK